MAKPFERYQMVVVESYRASSTSGLHGDIHIRPVEGQGFDGLHVECSKSLSRNYAPGTKFRLKAKLTDREDGGEYLYSYHGWPVELIK